MMTTFVNFRYMHVNTSLKIAMIYFWWGADLVFNFVGIICLSLIVYHFHLQKKINILLVFQYIGFVFMNMFTH